MIIKRLFYLINGVFLFGICVPTFAHSKFKPNLTINKSCISIFETKEQSLDRFRSQDRKILPNRTDLNLKYPKLNVERSHFNLPENEFLDQIMTAVEMLAPPPKQLAEKWYMDRDRLKNTVYEAREFASRVLDVARRIFTQLDNEFGKGNYSVVTLERGMRDVRLALEHISVREKMDVKVTGLTADTDFVRNIIDEFGSEGQEMIHEYLKDNGLDDDELSANPGKQVVVIDTGWWGQTMRNFTEVLGQSRPTTENSRNFAGRITKIINNNSTAIVIGDGDFEVSKNLSQLGVKVIRDPYGQRVPPTAFSTSELKGDYFSKFSPDLIDQLKNGTAYLVFADTDPSSSNINHISNFLRENTIEPGKVIITRHFNKLDQKFRKNLHYKLLLSSNHSIPSMLGNYEDQFVRWTENSPKQYLSVRTIVIDKHGNIEPEFEFDSPMKQAEAIVWEYALGNKFRQDLN